MAASDIPLVLNHPDPAMSMEIWEGVGRGGRLFIKCAGPLRISIAASGNQVYNILGDRYVFDHVRGDFTYSDQPGYVYTNVVMKPAPPERGFSKPTNPDV